MRTPLNVVPRAAMEAPNAPPATKTTGSWQRMLGLTSTAANETKVMPYETLPPCRAMMWFEIPKPRSTSISPSTTTIDAPTPTIPAAAPATSGKRQAERDRAWGGRGMNVCVPVPDEATAVGRLLDAGWAVSAGERFRFRGGPAIRVSIGALEPANAVRLADALTRPREVKARTRSA
jgi:hypothetical protein